MDLFEPILEVINWIAPPLYKYVEYYRKLDKYMEKLKKSMEELSDLKEEIEGRLRVGCCLGKLQKNEVKYWLKNVQEVKHDAENIQHLHDNKGKGFSRARLGKLIDKKIQQVKEYHRKGSSFGSLVIDAPPAMGITFPTKVLAGERTAKTMDEIWGCLMDNEVKKIGVYGMAGIGKTTIITHINNRLINEETKFDNVIWVTVSQTVDLMKLQNEIATALKVKFPETEEIIRRAGMLSETLKGRRFVLILDGIWENIPLEELGVSGAIKENRCKLVIATRSLDICHFMDCKPIEVKPLLEKEASELFLNKVELNISEVPDLEEVVKLVVKQCGGVPHKIVTVANSMRGVYDLHEWRNALNELSKNVKGIENEVFECSKISDTTADEVG